MNSEPDFHGTWRSGKSPLYSHISGCGKISKCQIISSDWTLKSWLTTGRFYCCSLTGFKSVNPGSSGFNYFLVTFSSSCCSALTSQPSVASELKILVSGSGRRCMKALQDYAHTWSFYPQSGRFKSHWSPVLPVNWPWNFHNDPCPFKEAAGRSPEHLWTWNSLSTSGTLTTSRYHQKPPWGSGGHSLEFCLLSRGQFSGL